MSDKRYMVSQQMLFVDPEHYDAIMNGNAFFTPAPAPARPKSIWERLAGIRAARRGNPGAGRFRVLVPLHADQNLRRTRRRIVVRIFMVDNRTDVAYNPMNAYFGRPTANAGSG